MALDQLGLMFEVPEEKLAAKAPIWCQALDDLSPELVELAVKRFFRGNKWDEFPQPGALRAYVKDELADELRRKAEEWNRGVREREALPAPKPEPMTPEEIAAAEAKRDALLAETRRVIAERSAVFVDERDLDEAPQRRSVPDIRASLAGFRLRDPDDPAVQATLREMEAAE